MNNQRKIIFSIFFLIILISTILRLYQLNSGLWIDEITTYQSYARLPFSQIVTSFESENQHFLYSLLAHASFLLFGESNWALRLPAVLFGVASIIALFFLGLKTTSDIEALLATALMAFSYHHLWFSQNARGYSGMLFWTLLSSWLLLSALRQKKTLWWVLFGVCSALGVYTHLTMLFVVVGQFLVAGASYVFRQEYRHRRYLFQILLGFSLAALLTLLFHVPVIREMGTVIGGTQVSLVNEWKSPLWTAREILTGLEVGFSGILAAGIALSLLIVGLLSYWRSYPEVVGLFVVPPVIGAVFTIAIGHHLWPRFFFFALGFGALILIRGVMITASWIGGLFRIPDRHRLWLGIACSSGLILLSALSMPFAYGPKQDFDSAVQYLEQHLVPGDQVVTVSIASHVFEKFYKMGWTDITTSNQLNQIRLTSTRTWLVYTFPEVMEAVTPEIANILDQEFALIKEFPGTVRSGTIYIYRADPHPTNNAELESNQVYLSD